MQFSQVVCDYLTEQRIGRLATATLDGIPHVTAVGYVNDDENVYISTFTKTKKVRNIRKNSKVAFIVDDTPVSTGWRYVIVEGEAEEVTDSTRFESLKRVLYTKYPVLDSDEWGIKKQSHSIVVINPSKVLTANLT